MAISCAHCGGTHDDPAEVKACWTGDDQSAARRLASARTTEPRAGSISGPRPASTSARSNAASAVPAPPASLEPPSALGRNVVIAVGSTPPPHWRNAVEVVVDAAALASPVSVVEWLRSLAHTRKGAAILIDDVVAARFRPDQPPDAATDLPPHEVGARFSFELDELHHLVWANAVDVRDPAAPRWPLLDRAVALGARLAAAGDPVSDIVLPDGEPAWLDGGPVRVTEPIDGIAVLPAVSVEHGSLAPPLDNASAADLATDQLAAVTHSGGAARIIAPAGSGKTRVLTERARHVLGRWRLPAGAVTLVAFNKRAQEEMRERTADLSGLQVRTLNSLALAIVNGTPPFAAQPRQVTTIDEVEVRRLLGDLVDFPRRRNTDPVAPWIEALGQIRLGLLDPADVEAQYDGDVDGLTRVWPAYRAALQRRGAVDFDGQIHGAVELLLTDPAIRRAAQRACRVLLVDEFQDLTPAHVLLIRLLAAPGGSVFGVGDDDQTIYGYNGADPAWLIEFDRLLPGAGFHPLEVNYRCPAEVVEAADRLLRHNRRRVPKVIRAARTATPGTGWSVASSDDPVADAVAAVERELTSGRSADQIAVLTRVNAVLAPVQAGLTVRGVPISGGVGLEFVERTSVRAVLAWLRLAQGRFHPDDLHEALRRPSRPLHPRITEWVAEQRDVDGLHRLAARLNQERESDRVAGFADDLATMQAMVRSGASTSELVDHLVDELGLAGAVSALDATRRGMNRSAQGDDLTAVRQLAAQHADAAEFESWLRDQLATRREPGGVLLSTVHRVKGQEWPVVVVHLAAADQYPHRLADDIEEERRVFHVALTRASARAVVVTGPRPSRFVDELSIEPPEHPAEPEPLAARRNGGTAAGRAKRSATPDHPLLDRATVIVAPGVELVDQGTTWTVVETGSDGAVARHGDSVRRFAPGSAVVTAGRQRGALRVAGDGVDGPTAVAFDLLRSFRERRREQRPAYTVFDDSTLLAIATGLPGSLDELAAIRGIGPAKLDQYGDEILELIEAALVGPIQSHP